MSEIEWKQVALQAATSLEEIEGKLKLLSTSAEAVHINMLSGKIARLSVEQIAHLYPEITTLRATVERVQAENNRLREALKPFVAHWEEWMMNYPAEQRVSTAARVTFGELRTARAALDPQ